MGWLNWCPNVSCWSDAGHCTTPSIGWLNSHPNDSFCSDSGQVTPVMGWLNLYPNDSRRSEVGQVTPVMGWLNLYPNDSRRNEVGHTSSMIFWLKSRPNDKCVGQRRLETLPNSIPNSCFPMFQSKRAAARTNATVSQRLALSSHKLDGVSASTRTFNVGVFLTAAHKSRHSSCNSFVDVYQGSPRIDCLRATSTASRHGPVVQW